VVEEPTMSPVLNRIPLIAALFAVLCLPCPLSAQALTPAFTYQGELRLASGPATGSYDLQFRLYTSPTGTTQIGATVTATGVAVSGGLFAVPLDFGPTQFAGDRQWLEISVRPAGAGSYETLAPRTEVTAAPYAWGAAVALANSVTTTSVVDGTLQGADLAPGAVGTTQINATQVQRRVSGTCSGTQGVQAVNADGSVVCGNFVGSGGTVTSIATGAGLTGGPIMSSGTISVAPGGIGAALIDTGQVQQRVTGSCGGTQFMRQIAEDGSVSCGSVPPTPSWSLSGNAATNPATNFIGTTDAQPFVVRTANARSLRIEPSTITFGTPALPITTNTIGGSHANSVTAGVRGATIAGGGLPSGDSDPGFPDEAPNQVAGNFGTIGGGYANSAFTASAVSGGYRNDASGAFSAIGGGFNNTASGIAGVIGGGYENVASASTTTIGGGGDNQALRSFATVGGGSRNTASGERSAVVGGGNNTASGEYSTVSGGLGNCAGGRLSWAGGVNAKVRPGTLSGEPTDTCIGVPVAGENGHAGTFVWADSSGADFISTGSNQFLIRAGGGVAINTASPALNAALTVTGGDIVIRPPHDLRFGASTGQLVNLYNEDYGIGVQTLTLYQRSDRNFAWYAEGSHSDTGFAPGSGGATLMTLTPSASPTTATVTGQARAQTFVSVSDRAMKTAFADLDVTAVLARVLALPIQSWVYRNAPEQRHIGPVAQDFRAAFGLGADETTIATIDADGVALAAIQGLNAKLEAENAALREQLQALVASQSQRERVIEERLSAIEAQLHHERTPR
jgi:hypothetical protein